MAHTNLGRSLDGARCYARALALAVGGADGLGAARDDDDGAEALASPREAAVRTTDGDGRGDEGVSDERHGRQHVAWGYLHSALIGASRHELAAQCERRDVRDVGAMVAEIERLHEEAGGS